MALSPYLNRISGVREYLMVYKCQLTRLTVALHTAPPLSAARHMAAARKRFTQRG